MESLWIAGIGVLFILVIWLIWRGGTTEGFQTNTLNVNPTIVCPQLKLIQSSTKDTIEFLKGTTEITNKPKADVMTQQEEMQKLYQNLLTMLKC